MVVVSLLDVIGWDEIRKHSIENPNGDEGDDGCSVEFIPGDPNLPFAVRKFWGLVLMLALRDKASSIHYHPWRAEGALSYVVDNVRYEMVPPPAEFASECVDAAFSLFVPPVPWYQRWFRGPRQRTVSSTIRVEMAADCGDL